MKNYSLSKPSSIVAQNGSTGLLAISQKLTQNRIRSQQSLEANLIRHRLIEKLGKAHILGRSKSDTQRRINQVDEHGCQFMTHAERICRKLKSGRICFSPESVIWIKREQIYCSLVEYKQGRNKNRGNLKQAARAQKIKNPFQISLAQLKVNLEVCEERNDYFRMHGARYRKKHLLTRAGIARDEGREKAAAQILAIIKREQDRSFWRRMNYTCGKTRTPPPISVQVEGSNGSVTEHDTQASVHEAIWTNILGRRGSGVPRTTPPRSRLQCGQ